MPNERFTEHILHFIGNTDYKPKKLRELARSMGVAEKEYGQFRDTVKALMDTGRLVMGSSKVLMLPEPSNEIVGSFRLNPRGFGFVIPELPDAHGDLFVPPGEALNAITGDTVRAKVIKRGKRGGKMLFEGRITEILTRGQNQFVGELCREFSRWFVRPDGNTIHGPVFVDDPGAKSARQGDQVVFEVLRYPEPGREARGVIVRVLGKRGTPDVDLLSMIVQHQLPEEFPPEVQVAAGHAGRDYDPQAALEGREDLRKMTVITIDPDDARDFDDAISITRNKNGTTELGVHIADVSHFVEVDGIIDQEAAQRTTSIYFPKHVIPMLPEVLSNGVCSLQERQPRLTKSAFITYNRKGQVLKTRFANSVISSTKRLTYKQATAIIEGRPGRISKKAVDLVLEMEKLARTIQKRRIAEGMLVLDLPEVDLVFDKDDNVIGTTPTDTSFSHTIIEMFMVEANEAVGRLLAELGVPNIRRIHPEPDEVAGNSLGKFLGALGIKVPPVLDRFAMQSILKKVKGKTVAFAANLALLRSMQPAEYSPKLIGHFALASQHYVHFTSPIRRYPDLLIHRLLNLYLTGKLSTKRDIAATPSFTELERMGLHCSRNERRAEAAERELRLVKILRLLEQRLGDVMKGVVTGVTNFGIYVQISEHLVDGLLRFEDLSDDWWEVDTSVGCVVAQRSGRRISIGQEIDVIIAAVDLAARQLNLALSVDGKQKSTGRAKIKKKSTAAARGSKRRCNTKGKMGTRKKSGRKRGRR